MRSHLLVAALGLLALTGTAFAGPFGLPIPVPQIPGAKVPGAPAAQDPADLEAWDGYALAKGAVWCKDKEALKAGSCSDVTFIKGEKVQAMGRVDKDGILKANITRGGFQEGFVKGAEFARKPDLTEYQAWIDGLPAAYPEDIRVASPFVNWMDLQFKKDQYKGKKFLRGYGATDRKELKYLGETGYVEWLDRVATQADAPPDKTGPVLMRFKNPELVALYKAGQIGYSCSRGGSEEGHCDFIRIVAHATGETRDNVGSGGVVMKWPIFEVEVMADRFGVWKAAQ